MPPDVVSDTETLPWGMTPNKPMEPAGTQNNAGMLETPEKPMEPDEDPELPPDVDSEADGGDNIEVSDIYCVCKRGCAQIIGDKFVEEEIIIIIIIKIISPRRRANPGAFADLRPRRRANPGAFADLHPRRRANP